MYDGRDTVVVQFSNDNIKQPRKETSAWPRKATPALHIGSHTLDNLVFTNFPEVPPSKVAEENGWKRKGQRKGIVLF